MESDSKGADGLAGVLTVTVSPLCEGKEDNLWQQFGNEVVLFEIGDV